MDVIRLVEMQNLTGSNLFLWGEQKGPVEVSNDDTLWLGRRVSITVHRDVAREVRKAQRLKVKPQPRKVRHLKMMLYTSEEGISRSSLAAIDTELLKLPKSLRIEASREILKTPMQDDCLEYLATYVADRM